METAWENNKEAVLENAEDQNREPGVETADLNELIRSVPGLQSQFDRAISKALNTARSNWERERAEGQATQQSTAEQEKTLQEREEALLLRERRASAMTTLGEKGLPVELAECLRYESDESVARSLEALEKSFAAEVEKMVRERLKGAPPKAGSGAVYASQMRAALGLK